MRAIFSRKKNMTETDIKSFYFKVDSMPRFTAGQFTEITLDNKDKRWFTISNAPNEDEIRITTRMTGSDFKKALDSLKPGQEVYMADPMGDFVLPVDSSIPILMVAAGIGVTPFLSILGDQLNNPSKRSLNLIYAAKSKEDFLELSDYQKVFTSYIKIIGPLISKNILDEASKLNSPYIYISGPEPLVEKLIDKIKESGFPEENLIGDYFPGYN